MIIWSKFSRCFHAYLFSCCLVAVIGLAPFILLPPSFGSVATKQYDRLFEEKTEEHRSFISYPGAKMKSVVKVNVQLQNWEQQQPFNSNYKDYWFAGSAPVGCRQHRTLDCPRGKRVAIRLKHKTMNPSQAEIHAGANVIVRLIVQVAENGAFLQRVYVPAASVDEIVEALGKYHFYLVSGITIDQNEPATPNDNIHLVPEPFGKERDLLYRCQSREGT